MKTVRPIPIADPLWEALERMAVEMGTDTESIVNQAIHAWGRQNGFILPGGESGLPAAPGTSADPSRREAARRVLETAAALEDDIAASERTPTGEPRALEPGTLYVVGEGGEIDKVGKERFLIGRGKHCDLVVDSAKVSREHAAIVREADGWYLEDLGSANGTWFQRARIDRRKIQNGDEYFICSEKIRCVLR
ncbi:MAG TPA: FHA domain-containing protein [Anaeromyxobacteraceae bacterium]|nr:FHA domain-containing protein [Anaeromyxobacteraceae bacterium]